MKPLRKQWMAAGIIIIVSMQSLACNNVNNSILLDTTAKVTVPLPETAGVPAINSESSYNSSETMAENIITLNRILNTKYQRCLSVSDAQEYENAGSPSWTLILDGDKVGFDTATLKYDYEPDSEYGKYMDAVLTTFIFYYGDEMGDSLWRLTGDLLDNGADETEYGFKYNGGQVVYKDTRVASFGYPSNNKTSSTFYIWITPNETGEYKDVID